MPEIFIAQIVHISQDLENNLMNIERIIIYTDTLEEELGKFIVHKTVHPQIIDIKEDPIRLFGRDKINDDIRNFIINKPNEIWPSLST